MFVCLQPHITKSKVTIVLFGLTFVIVFKGNKCILSWREHKSRIWCLYNLLIVANNKQITQSQRLEPAMQPIDHPLPPTLQEFDMKLLDQTVVFTCETNVTQPKPAHIETPEQLLIENYYCYKIDQQLIKVTKVRIGTQLITLVDKLSFKRDRAQKQNKPKTSEISHPSDKHSSEVFLSARKKKLLNMFCEWMQKIQPQIKPVFDEALGKCLNQAGLRAYMRQNIELRTSLIAFKQALKQKETERSMYRLLKRWLKRSFEEQNQSNQSDETF